ncbi:hypothetical protein [Pedobacter sp. MC2016-24]|uniref:hypothetical protein n=1 Tax=Pedobacter sp. MC2016-24 TaxID=2780090 RepID=UPI00187E1EDD|nr:hypothetical protein [Pedobacter sp. MC2016-24]MBE9600736.1 hypothetical protein [Pedobacter sp. MC2016-24]
MNENPYKKARMTNWFQPAMLLNVALKSVISGTFGNYADRRELQAALSKDSDEDSRQLRERLVTERQEIWIDFICDTGDGFDSTYSVAKKAAQRQLVVQTEDEKSGPFTTIRGDVLILGGDEVYPFPTLDNYTNKFKVPFEAAGDQNEVFSELNRPLLFAIPGNHDWYDGLGNFMKLFCQQRSIGIWRTVQKRSYFAIPLPNNYWIWATDIQLNSNIDQPQLDYFTRIAKEEMLEGDKIILVTAEPAWVYKEIRKNDQSFDRLDFFIARHIRDEHQLIGKKFKLAINITGDLHHYSRYSRKENGHQYITSGGGGAFLHLTHNLPPVLNAIAGDRAEENITRKAIFPSASDAKRLLLGNLLFPFKNPAFISLACLVYVYLFWLLQSHQAIMNGTFFLSRFTGISLAGFFETIGIYFLGAPSIALSIGALFGGFWLFVDRVAKKPGSFIIGFVHASGQTMMLFATMFWLAQTELMSFWGSWWGNAMIVIIFGLVGGTLSSFLMGVYLYLSNRLLAMHEDESSSALANPNFKNFTRMRIHDQGIDIYPVGIKKVQNWTVSGTQKTLRVEGEDFETILIEPPIHVLDAELE